MYAYHALNPWRVCFYTHVY